MIAEKKLLQNEKTEILAMKDKVHLDMEEKKKEMKKMDEAIKIARET